MDDSMPELFEGETQEFSVPTTETLEPVFAHPPPTATAGPISDRLSLSQNVPSVSLLNDSLESGEGDPYLGCSTQQFDPSDSHNDEGRVEGTALLMNDDVMSGTQPFNVGTFEEADIYIANDLESMRRPPNFNGTHDFPETQPFDPTPDISHGLSSAGQQVRTSQSPTGKESEPRKSESESSSDGPASPDPFAPQSPDVEDAPLSPDLQQDSPGSPSPKSPSPIPGAPDSPQHSDIVELEERPVMKTGRRVIVEDSDEDEEKRKEGDPEKGSVAAILGDKGEEAASGDDKSEVGELIADIFGDSDAEVPSDDDQQASRPQEGSSKQAEGGVEEEEDDEEEADGSKSHRPLDFEWDFDVMLRKRREQKGPRRRRRKDGSVDLYADSDEIIRELVVNMKSAAKEDRTLNSEGKPASNKRKMLPYVISQLRKADLLEALVDFGIIGAVSEWLAPLPDKSLPALEVRNQMLKCLQQYPRLDQSVLRSSGIGKAVMILLKHPKETKENRDLAGKLISDWARPIFELDTDYRNLTKKERENRDYEHMPMAKRRRLSQETEGRPDAKHEEEERVLRPGDKGWIGRARVPRPSTKDYVVRPKWKVEGQFRGESGRKGSTPQDRKIREFKEKTKKFKYQHAIPVSIEGRKMPL